MEKVATRKRVVCAARRNHPQITPRLDVMAGTMIRRNSTRNVLR
jgi:hypothetical protein